jgi:hypothetical protein
MGMERRWGVRRPVEVDAWIDCQPACLLEGQISNISIGGLYVRTNASGLRLNAPVELVLTLDDEHETRVYRLPAVVVRLNEDGAGLMFDQYDVNAFRTLVVLLLERQRAIVAHRDSSNRRFLPSFNNHATDGGFDRAVSISEGVSGTAA